MTKIITQENFNDLYIDPIEQERIDKFVCDEMARQNFIDISKQCTEAKL